MNNFQIIDILIDELQRMHAENLIHICDHGDFNDYVDILKKYKGEKDQSMVGFILKEISMLFPLYIILKLKMTNFSCGFHMTILSFVYTCEKPFVNGFCRRLQCQSMNEKQTLSAI